MKFLKTFLILSLCFIFCEETKEANQKELKGWNFEINGSLGQISPITSSDRAKFNPGPTLGISMHASKPLTILKQKFSYGAGVNFGSLKGNTINTKKINTISFDLKTKFEKLPLDFKVGFGISDMTGSGAIGASGTIDIMHDLPNTVNNLDVSIGIRIQQIFDVNKDWKISHLHGLYGLNITIGRSIVL